MSDEKNAFSVQVDGFELLQEVGRGATARIVLARDKATGDRVCLKLFHPKLFQDATSQARIRREMDVSIQLKHPNILPVRSVVVDSESPLMVMDYIPGKNLEKFQGTLPFVLPEIAVLVAVEILKGVEYAHGKNVVHRDLKPENVLVREDGQVFVADFGLAKWRDHNVTNQSNTLLGSVDYMSPEQIKGDTVGPSADLFCIGAILYFLTTGTRPFTRPSLVATLDAVKNVDPEPPQKRNPKISNRLSSLIQKALKKSTSDRFASAKEMREALESYLNETGLGPNAISLKEWVTDPSGVSLDALKTATEALVAGAEKALSAKQWDKFIEIQSHLSLKAPDSEALKRLSASYREARNARGPKVPKAVIFALVFVGVLGGAVWGVKTWVSSLAEVEVPAPSVAPVVVVPNVNDEPKPELQPKSEPAKPAIPIEKAQKKVAAPKPAEPLKPGGGTVWFRVPEGSEVTWDNSPVDPTKPLYNQTFGKHRMRVVTPGGEPRVSEVEVTPSRPTFVKVN